jgi:hypothetical protein
MIWKYKLIQLSFQIPAEVEPEVNFSTLKKQRIVDQVYRPTCAAVSPKDGQVFVCLPER